MKQIRESILYFPSSDSAKTRQVKAVMVQMGIRIRNLSPDMAMQQVGYLAGCAGFYENEVRPKEQEIVEEMLIMKDFTNERLDELLKQLRKAEIPKIKLKAVMNENNKYWTLKELYEELRKENKAMSEG